MNIHDQVVLITGGRRVGRFVARELAQGGAPIIMTYLEDASEVAPVLQEIAPLAGTKTSSYQLDLTDEASIKQVTRRVAQEIGQVNALITMASVFAPDPADLSLQGIARTFAVNAFGNMLVSRWFAEQAQQHQATNQPLVSFIDWAVDHPYADHDVYVASKAALRHYLMALQTTFAGVIRVVNIHPGMILEPPGFSPQEKNSIIANTPVKQIGTPAQAAQLVRTALELDFLVDNVYLAGGQQWRHRL